jgi:hypothetical protein
VPAATPVEPLPEPIAPSPVPEPEPEPVPTLAPPEPKLEPKTVAPEISTSPEPTMIIEEPPLSPPIVPNIGAVTVKTKSSSVSKPVVDLPGTFAFFAIPFSALFLGRQIMADRDEKKKELEQEIKQKVELREKEIASSNGILLVRPKQFPHQQVVHLQALLFLTQFPLPSSFWPFRSFFQRSLRLKELKTAEEKELKQCLQVLHQWSKCLPRCNRRRRRHQFSKQHFHQLGFLSRMTLYRVSLSKKWMQH